MTDDIKNIKDGIAYYPSINDTEDTPPDSSKMDVNLTTDRDSDILVNSGPTLNHKTYTNLNTTVFLGYTLRTPQETKMVWNPERGMNVNVKKSVFDKNALTLRRNAIRTLIKNYDSLEESKKQQISKLIDISLRRLNEYYPFKNYGMVVSVESTAPLNKVLIQKIKPFLNPDTMIVDDMFVKDVVEKVELDLDMLERETLNTQKLVMQLYDKIINSKKPSYYVKDIKSSFRRYFIKFLKFNSKLQESTFKHIFGNTVLLVDDTTGEVSTFREMLRLLNEYKPKHTVCYAFLKDYDR